MAFLTMSVVPRPVTALATDQKQQIEIDSEKGELDDAKNINTFTGNVVVTQGSIRITGDKMTIHYNKKKEIEILVVDGNPATYRQLPDASKVYDEAQAKHMEYLKKKNLVILTDNALVKQESGSLRSDRIEYDTAHSRVTATSEPAGTEEKNGKKGRVKIIIPAKPD